LSQAGRVNSEFAELCSFV